MKNLYFLLVLFLLASCSVFKKTNQQSIAANQPHFVKIETDSGTMVVRLSNKTPKTTANFLKLVNGHFYDGLLFLRFREGFKIQGGEQASRNANTRT
jgi:peptidyl-prolyl cis-trans isomerase B (cyclophilin B)